MKIKKNFSIVFVLLLITNLVKAQDWIVLPYPGSPLTAEEIDYIFFRDDNNGVINTNFSSNFFKSTSDGGQNWSSIVYTSSFYENMNEVLPIDAQTFVGAGNDVVSYSPYIARGVIFKSIDGGTNWTRTYIDSAIQLDHICFMDNLNGIATGISSSYKAIIANTTDGGSSWNWIKIDTLGLPQSISYVDANFIWISTTNGLIKSTDGGNTWSCIHQNANTNFSKVKFINQNIGFAFSFNYQEISKTTDGGSTWNVITGASGAYDIDFLDENKGYQVCYDGNILKTMDGGATWDTTTGITANKLVKIFMLNEQKGWISGTQVFLGTSGTGVSDDNIKTFSTIKYIPNKESIEINSSVYNTELKIFDISGRCLLSKKIEKGVTDISVSKFNRGLYIVSIQANNLIKNIKILKD